MTEGEGGLFNFIQRRQTKMNENAMLMKKNKALHFSSYQDSVIGSFANKVVCKHLEEIPCIQFLQP